MAEDNKKIMSEAEYKALPEATKEAMAVKGILREDMTSEVAKMIADGRYEQAQQAIATNKEREASQREIDFTKNDIYNAGMAANFANKAGTLSRDSNRNKEELAQARKATETPLAIRNQALQQSLANSQYAQARGLGADVLGNRNAQNNQSYINALGAAAQSSNQAGNFGSQNQSLFNKKLMADRGTAEMQMKYQQIANQDLARNVAGSMQEDAAQNRFNGTAYSTLEALRARDVARGENRRDSFRNAIQETYDTVPYLASKWAGDYTNMSQQRNLDPNRRFMNNNLFVKSRRNPYINGAKPRVQNNYGTQPINYGVDPDLTKFKQEDPYGFSLYS